MLKVLIIDDEIWIGQLIQHSVNWQQLSMDVISVCQNGADGYEKICTMQPDIVITDIRMPQMDGIELIGKVRSNSNLQTQPSFIIVSGYQDFEYVQKALVYGASDYILKPFNEDQLVETLEKIRHKIGVEVAKSDEEQTVRKLLYNSLYKLRRNSLDDFFNNRQSIQGVAALNKDFSFSFQEESFIVTYIQLVSKSTLTPTDENLAYITEHFEAGILQSNFCKTFSYCKDNQVVSLINFNIANGSNVIAAIKNSFRILIGDEFITNQLHLSLGWAEIPVVFAGLQEAYSHAKDSAYCGVLTGYNRTYDLSQLSLTYIKPQQILTDKLNTELTNAIERLDPKQTSSIIKELFQALLKNQSLHPASLRELGYSIAETYNSITQKMNIPSEEEENVLPMVQITQAIEYSGTAIEIANKLAAILSKSLLLVKDIKLESFSKPVLTAQKYVRENYAAPIYLQDVSQQVFLNPQYFSELFKNEVGISFSDYLANYRIEIAKKLLALPGEKIKDIGAKVGYTDSKSFSKLFRKRVGISPQEYRKLFG